MKEIFQFFLVGDLRPVVRQLRAVSVRRALPATASFIFLSSTFKQK